jgi:hypothetical protein
MPLVEVQPRTEIQPGTYEAVVSNVEHDTIVPRTGRNAGQTVPILRWNFVIDGVDDRIESITGRDPSSEKSNLFKYFVATLGADKSAWMSAETEDLVGKPVLVTLSVTDEGWPRVDNVTARPVRRGPTAQPVSPAPIATAMEPGLVEDESLQGDLPF